ncbi:MAG TPA: hypothetical protein DCL43_01285, partial [Chitinophagaceae bacterium]|nr:hypothetical protein [Chitinophagaceae bacterium]
KRLNYIATLSDKDKEHILYTTDSGVNLASSKNVDQQVIQAEKKVAQRVKKVENQVSKKGQADKKTYKKLASAQEILNTANTKKQRRDQVVNGVIKKMGVEASQKAADIDQRESQKEDEEN